MFVACSIKLQKFLNASNEHFTEAMDVQSSYHLQCYTLQLLYSCDETDFSPLLFPCRTLCSLSTDTEWSRVNLCSLIAVLKAKFQRFHCYFQVETKFSSLDAELHRFYFYQMQNLYKKEYTQLL